MISRGLTFTPLLSDKIFRKLIYFEIIKEHIMTNEDKRFEQLRFECKFIVIPYVIYAVIVLLLNIFYSDLKITMTLFGLFFAYNV